MGSPDRSGFRIKRDPAKLVLARAGHLNRLRAYVTQHGAEMKNLRFWLPTLIGFLVITALWLLLPYTIESGADHGGTGLGQLLVLYQYPC